MASAIRFYAAGLLLSAAILGAAVFRPAWLGSLGIELAPRHPAGCWTVLDPGPEFHRATRRIEAKRQVVHWLIAGQLNLREAAAYFRFIDQDLPGWQAARERLPAATEEEQLCRQVIDWVKVVAHSDLSDEGAAAVARLEADLDMALRQPGGAGRLAQRRAGGPGAGLPVAR